MIHEQKRPEYWQLRTLGIALSMVLMHWANRCLTPYLVLPFDWVLQDWRDQVQAAKDSVDPSAMLSRYQTDVVAALDKEAQEEIERAARQVATVTAMVPIPWIDMLAAFGSNLRMIRRIGEIYGGRSGPVGSWRLPRSISAHLMATGALAVWDDWLGSVFAGSLLSHLSRRFGEGMVNVALTARVGRAAIDVYRPMPFNMQEHPKISVVLRRALTGIFDKMPD